MSTIKVTTIQDTGGGNSSTTEEIYSGRAKAWVNFNGQGTVAIRADFNVNTVGDSGTGDYTVNFTTALADTNYAAVCGSGQEEDYSVTVDSYATGSIGVRGSLMQSAASARDVEYCNVAIFR